MSYSIGWFSSRQKYQLYPFHFCIDLFHKLKTKERFNNSFFFSYSRKVHIDSAHHRLFRKINFKVFGDLPLFKQESSQGSLWYIGLLPLNILEINDSWLHLHSTSSIITEKTFRDILFLNYMLDPFQTSIYCYSVIQISVVPRHTKAH